MAANNDFTLGQPGEIKILDMIGCTAVDDQIQHLVKIAVVQAPVPADRKCRSAHDAVHGLGIEGALQDTHVIRQISAALQIVAIATDGAVDQAEQRVKLQAVNIS